MPSANPFAPSMRAARGGARVHGECSLNTFADVGGLSYCHDDAKGFGDYLNQFNAANYWFKDAGVQYWEYTEPYDHWQDTYGADAVRIFYHSGHGGMDANGVFYAPLGANWGGQTWVNSTQMTLANQTLRYAFWSTCLSLRIHEGHSPWRTWADHANGLRMIFGWETVSWDNGGYGANFFRHWNAERKFSRAWLQAGWDAGHDQAPSAAAMGATPEEAQNRVFNEGHFYGQPAVRNWMWWVWWDAARSVGAPATLQAPPADAYVLSLGGLGGRRKSLNSVGDTTIVGDTLAHIRLASPVEEGATVKAPMSGAKMVSAADGVVSALALNGIELAPAYTRMLRSAGASESEQTPEAVAGYAVEYRQLVDGVPVVSPDAGYLRVLLDAEGKPSSATLTARPIKSREARPVRSTPQAGTQLGTPLDAAGIDVALATHLDAAAYGAVSAAPLPETRQVGYLVDGTSAHLGASQGTLVDFGGGLFKKVRATVALNN